MWGSTRQRSKNSSDPMWTFFSEPPLNSTSTIVATALENESSTCALGSAKAPGVVFVGGRTVNEVVNVSNGSSSMCAVTRLSPAAQSGPAMSAAVALPSASSSTVTPRPSLVLNGFGTYQVTSPLQRLN